MLCPASQYHAVTILGVGTILANYICTVSICFNGFCYEQYNTEVLTMVCFQTTTLNVVSKKTATLEKTIHRQCCQSLKPAQLNQLTKIKVTSKSTICFFPSKKHILPLQLQKISLAVSVVAASRQVLMMFLADSWPALSSSRSNSSRIRYRRGQGKKKCTSTMFLDGSKMSYSYLFWFEVMFCICSFLMFKLKVVENYGLTEISHNMACWRPIV